MTVSLLDRRVYGFPAATPALAAELHALEAQGLALLGEANAARRAALTAQRVYESVRPGEELPWRGFYTEHALIADVGSTMITQRLGTLHRRIQPLRASSPHLRELDERLTTFFTRSARPN